MTTARTVAFTGITASLLLTLVQVAVGQDQAEKVTFQDDALPVLRQRCGSCHNADKKTAGLDVTSYVGIMLGGGSGEVIAPGDASSSYLFRVVTHEDEPTMPPDGPPIPEAEQAILRKWIDGGVLETKGSVAMLPKKKADVAMAGSTMERPEIVPQPAKLPLEPAVHTDALDACGSIATSPWASLAAVAGQKQVLLYRTDSLELDGVLPFPEGRPHVVRFSRGGGLVLAGGGVGAASGKVVVWDVFSGRRVQEVGDELDVVLAADISPDQRMIALGGPQRVVRVFSAETGDILQEHTKHTDWVQSIAYSPDGVLLATADRSGGVFLWEAISGRDYMTITAHPAAVTSVAWRADANLLATGCEDGQIRLWELENGNQIKAWGAHGGGVSALEFTRDGRIVSIGRDRVAKLWSGDGAEERSFEAFADLGLAVSFCDETSRVIAGDWTGEIRVFHAADGARLGQLDQNPQPLASRVASAEQAMTQQRQALAAAEAAVAAGEEALSQQLAALQATAAQRQQLDAMLADLVTQQQQMTAGLEASRTGHAELLGQFAEAEAAVAAAMAEVERVQATLATVGEDAAAREAAEQALTAAQTAQIEAMARRDQLQPMVSAKATEVASAEQQVAELGARHQQATVELQATEARRLELEGSVAAMRQQTPELAAAAMTARDAAASAAASLARWYDEYAFQSKYDAAFASLTRAKAALGEAEIAHAEAEAARQVLEQARQAEEAKLAELRGQVTSLEAANAASEQEIASLTAQLEQRAGEIAAAEGSIERILQAMAALNESAADLDRGLAALPEDAELKAAREAIAGVIATKQSQLQGQQDAIAAMRAEEAGWETSLEQQRQAIVSRQREIATVTGSIATADQQLHAATAEVQAATATVEQQTGTVAERQQAVDAAEAALDTLQGITS